MVFEKDALPQFPIRMMTNYMSEQKKRHKSLTEDQVRNHEQEGRKKGRRDWEREKDENTKTMY